MNLPDKLKHLEVDLVDAIGKIPQLAEWPEETTYVEAESPGAIADVIIPVLHEHLVKPQHARIAHLYREQIKNASGVCSKAGGKLAFLSDYDFTIDYNWTTWRVLSAEQKIALVDHELTHCAWDSDKEKWCLREHDIEEFRDMVQRWGLWHPGLARFGEDVIAAQVELFAQPAA